MASNADSVSIMAEYSLGLTSTQIGTIGESLLTAEVMYRSAGRLNVFKVVSDDDGVDLIIFDKQTRTSLPLQVKASMAVKRKRHHQFDVRMQTWHPDPRAFVACILLEELTVRNVWLIPQKDLPELNSGKAAKYAICPTIEPKRETKYCPYSSDTSGLVAKLIEVFASGQ